MEKWAFDLSNFKTEFNGRGRARNHIEVMPDSPSGVFPLTSAPDLKLGPFFLGGKTRLGLAQPLLPTLVRYCAIRVFACHEPLDSCREGPNSLTANETNGISK